MRTLVFATKAEGADLQRLLGGQIFGIMTREAIAELDRHLTRDENAVAILVGQAYMMGWSTYLDTHILFSQKFPKDEASRTQARGRVRLHKSS